MSQYEPGSFKPAAGAKGGERNATQGFDCERMLAGISKVIKYAFTNSQQLW